MTTGTAFFNMLDGTTKDVSNALDELNAVITGGAFSRETVWPAGDVPDPVAHAAAIGPAMAALTVHDGVEDAIDRLFAGASGGSINSAIKAATDAVQKVLDEASKLNDEIGVQDRVDAFNELNDPRDPGSPTPPSNAAPYGFIPAIEGVINAAASTSVDLDNALGPLKAVGAAVAAGGAYAIFSAYATASMAMLNKALTIGTVGTGDR